MTALTRRQILRSVGVASLALVAGCGPLPWQAQAQAPAPRVARVGILSTTIDPDDADNEAFRQGMRDLGYVEGQNVTLEWRAFGNRLEALPALAAELTGLGLDVAVAQGAGATQAFTLAAPSLPVVMAFSSDPVRGGLVTSLAHPGGNVTGLAALTGQLGAKQLEILRDIVPGLARVAMLWNPEGAARTRLHEFEETAAAAQSLGFDLQPAELRHGGELESAFASILRARADAVLVQSNPVVNAYRAEIMAFTTEHRLPSTSSRRAFVVAGSLMAYGPMYAEMNRRAAYYVDRILKGAQPADLPVEQPMRFDFVINLKAAQALSLTIPQHVLLQATEVLQ